MSEAHETVFIVDDDADIRSSLSRSLSKRGFEVETFESALVFLESYDPERPGCLILDHGMPEMTGLELQQLLVDQDIALPVIFITGHGGVPESVRAIKAGAIDFLEKPFRQDVLVERISTAFKLDTENRQKNAPLIEARAAFERLTDREQEIASLMVSQPSDASSKELARHLDISPRTVDHHRARILEKMNVRSIAELVDLTIRASLVEQK